MIAAELRGGGKPSLNEALGWIGSRVDDVFGSAIGRLEDVWIDPATGEPRWLLVKEGRFGGRSTLVPFDQATAGDDTVWIPYERSVVREAPQIEPGVPLTQQVEATLRNHYAANTAAAVAHGYQSADREAGQEGSPDSRATSATVRLATAGSQPEPMPPPQLPLRPAPPIDAPPGPERQDEPYGHEPAAEGQPPPPSPFPPPSRPGAGHQPPPPAPAQPTRPEPQPPPGQPMQPWPQQSSPGPQPPRQQVPPEQPHPQHPYGYEPQPTQPQPQPPQQVPPEQPRPQQPYGYEPQPTQPQPQPPPHGYEPQPSAPVPLPPQPAARGGYQPPPVQQVPPPPDPLDVLAGLPPGHMVEIELSGSLTISGELRHARVVPPGTPSSRR